MASRVSDVGHRIRLGRFLGASTVGDGRDLMGTASGPYSSLDDQIFACIEAAKTWDKDAKLEDFQLRVVANDLVLIHLKTSRAYVLNDEESDLPDLGWSVEKFRRLQHFYQLVKKISVEVPDRYADKQIIQSPQFRIVSEAAQAFLDS